MDVITKEVKSNGQLIRIHGFQTGRLAIKQSAMHSKKTGVWPTLKSFRDKTFADWLPVWCWAIEHPEGVFLIDTGLSSVVNQKHYFRKIDIISRYYFEKQMKFDIAQADEIDQQLKKVKLDSKAVSKVILTHLHIDHVGGLPYFTNVPVLVNEREWQSKDGAFPGLFPDKFTPEIVTLSEQFQVFQKAHYITQRRDLLMVETTGHTTGHTSVILKVDEGLLFFAGDLAYTQSRLQQQQFSTTIKSHKQSIITCQKVKEMAQKEKVIFLPSHDHQSGNRLANLTSL
ncbi:hypothetical protein BKI52_36935 [marine bacterium AO1-C]|nr:hypothetical protein BKI52_36935 [marine bacterium AO1-C]